MTESEAYVAFNLTEQIGSVGVGEFVSRAGSVAAAWEAYPKKVARAGGEVDWRGEFEKAKRFGVTILTPADAAYPSVLRATQGHPLVLYVKGDAAALSKPALALVGTRRATAYGLDQANRFAYDLAKRGWTIVSGLALGIDAEAHRGALAAEGLTVGVLGSGLDRFYPEENRELAREIVRKGGAVVSEFPFGRPPDTQTFPQRNHVVAALVRGVIAIEAPVKSGTLITTGIAADLGRTVMAVPARVDSRMSSGCLKLIREGARLVRDARDVEEEMSELIPRSGAGDGKDARREIGDASGDLRRETREEDARRETREEDARRETREEDARRETRGRDARRKTREGLPVPQTSIEEAMILKHVDAEGVPMDRLVQLTGLPAGTVNALAMALRMRDRVRFLPGNRVALPREA